MGVARLVQLGPYRRPTPQLTDMTLAPGARSLLLTYYELRRCALCAVRLRRLCLCPTVSCVLCGCVCCVLCVLCDVGVMCDVWYCAVWRVAR
jgi:hypothetical protein